MHSSQLAGSDRAAAEGCYRRDYSSDSGISTVSELMLGMDYGLKEFKFFPAEANGGVKALQAIAGPFSRVRFCPTGGISPANYRDYLALKSVLCIGGSWLVPADALEAGDYDRITKLAREAVEGAKL
ncbi:hypothetical protein ECZU17_51110 [Escherichia coli]|nr:hypothetical protein ECZU17_51110 [Escherichia coli]